MYRIQHSDRKIRLHRTPCDSAQNESKRTNACIGDAVVDGGALQWETVSPLQGLTDEQIEQLTIEEIEEREKNVSEINAWHVAKELAVRVDDEPGPGGDYMIVNVAEKLGKLTKLGAKCLLTRKL